MTVVEACDAAGAEEHAEPVVLEVLEASAAHPVLRVGSSVAVMGGSAVKGAEMLHEAYDDVAVAGWVFDPATALGVVSKEADVGERVSERRRNSVAVLKLSHCSQMFE